MPQRDAIYRRLRPFMCPEEGVISIGLGGGVQYEAENVKTSMNSVTLQPHVADHAYMAHMKAMYVPFHMGYSSLICY